MMFGDNGREKQMKEFALVRGVFAALKAGRTTEHEIHRHIKAHGGDATVDELSISLRAHTGPRWITRLSGGCITEFIAVGGAPLKETTGYTYDLRHYGAHVAWW